MFGKVVALGAAVAGVTLLSMAPSPEREKVPLADEGQIRENVLGELRSALSGGALSSTVDVLFAKGDVEGVAMYLQAAELAGVPVPDGVKARFKDETVWWKSLGRGAANCGAGAVTGKADSVEGIACSVAADMTVVGDLRDGIVELAKVAQGGEPDYVVLGLVGAGLALEAAATVSGGTSLGAKAGTSVLKVGAKTATVSRRLVGEIGAVAKGAVNLAPIRALDASDLKDAAKVRHAAGQALDSRKLAPLTEAAERLDAIRKRGTLADAVMVVKTADRLEDLKAAEKLSKAFGDRTASVLRVLGRDAFELTEFAFRVAAKGLSIVVGFLLSLLSGLMWTFMTLRWVWRLLRPKPKPRWATAEPVPAEGSGGAP